MCELAKTGKGTHRQRRGAAALTRQATLWRFVMPVHLTDSLIYRNSWGTPELRELFDDVPRTRSWLDILAVLAETQAEYGLIPLDAAQDVATTCRTVELNIAFFEEVRAGFEATNHS